jgi:glycosyltransferase involved in cell wall biosynthesis
MNPRVRVSIVIPAYNEEFHLRACLQAIAEQTVQPYEVIVVDNNSTDATVAVATSYPFVRVVSATRQGIVYARNAGFDAATGDVIGRIDADIILPSHWVEHIEQFYRRPENQTVAWSGAGSFYNVRMPRLVSWAYSLLAFHFTKLLTGHYTLWGSNMALTRKQWQTVRSPVCMRHDIHEDLDLAMHLARAGYTIVYDTGIKTSAELRRVTTDRRQLWAYLQWWPRALRIHGNVLWPLCWFFGVLPLYVAAYILVVADYMATKDGVPARSTVASD